jgi:hypothetical protein
MRFFDALIDLSNWVAKRPIEDQATLLLAVATVLSGIMTLAGVVPFLVTLVLMSLMPIPRIIARWVKTR